MIQKELLQDSSDRPKPVAAATARAAAAAGGSSEANKAYSSGPAAATVSPSSHLWLGPRDSRIVRVSRALGGKDRHSKVSTARGLRDRRVRLSVQTAIQLYDLQDRLGLSQPSKVVDWLLDVAQNEIDKLPPLHFPPHFPHVGNSWGAIPHEYVIGRRNGTCTTQSNEEDQHRNDDAKGSRVEGQGVDPSNSTPVSYQQLGAVDDVLPNGSSTMTAASQRMPGSYALHPTAVPIDDPSCLFYNHRLAVAAAPPSQLSFLPGLGAGTRTSSTPSALLFCTSGTSASPPSLIQAYTVTSASSHHPKLLDHFHSVDCTTTATSTSPISAPQSYFTSTN